MDDYEALPYYPYRDDAILLHQVIWDYVREVLELHYGMCFWIDFHLNLFLLLIYFYYNDHLNSVGKKLSYVVIY